MASFRTILNSAKEVARLLDGDILAGARLFLDVPVGTRTSVRIPHGLGRPYIGFICCSGDYGLRENKANPDKDQVIIISAAAPAGVTMPDHLHFLVF